MERAAVIQPQCLCHPQGIVHEAVPHTDKRIQFIGGLSVYEAAGGAVKRDLFDEDDGGYALDAVKVETMVAQKFAEIEAEVKAEGWAWTLIMPVIDYDYVRTLNRSYPETLPLSEADQGELDRRTVEYDELVELIEADGADDEAEARLETIEEQMVALDRREQVYAPDVIAKSGAIISLDYHGKASIERGFIRVDEQENAEAGQGVSASDRETTKTVAPILTHSAALIQNLTAQKTAALRVELANNREIALAAVVHAMLLKVAHTRPDIQSALQITLTHEHLETSMKDAASCRALYEMDYLKTSFGDRIPANPADLWQWCLSLDRDNLLELLAYAAAHSVNAAETKFNNRSSALSHANQLGDALKVNMNSWFEPDAANYFSQINRAGIETAIHEAAGEQAALAVRAATKKSEAAIIAERLVKGTGWLPEHIRINVKSDEHAYANSESLDDMVDDEADNDSADFNADLDECELVEAAE